VTAAVLRLRLGTPTWREARFPTLLGAALLLAVGAAVAVRLPAAQPITAATAAGLGLVAIWMFASARYEWTLAVVMLYLGLADGYLKLKTGTDLATLGRDVLLYAIVAGALVRWAIRGERVERPPLTAWVIAWIAVIVVQLFNPANGETFHSLSALRPHLEFVPLFFLGYTVMRSKRRLRAFLLLMLVVTAANGVVGLIQFNLTPDQLASWGPGYAEKISGSGDVSARGFVTDEGETLNRPFALGSDMGFGGAVGVLAVPAALGLLAVGGGGIRLPVTLLSAGVIVAVATSQARVAVVGAVVAALAYAALSVTSRGAFRAVMALALAVLVTYVSISVLVSNSDDGSFRYDSIAPSKAANTTYEYRRDNFARIPEYIRDFPLGAGIGSKGPAASVEGGYTLGRKLDAESQPTFLLIEAGLPALLVMLGFNLKLIGISMRRIRRLGDPELRLLLAAVAAPLLAMFATWVVGIATATSPGAPYLWFAAGILAYWLIGRPEARAPDLPPRAALVTPPPSPPPRPVAPAPPPEALPRVPAPQGKGRWQDILRRAMGARRTVRRRLGTRLH
jgi:hypothetical protein